MYDNGRSTTSYEEFFKYGFLGRLLRSRIELKNVDGDKEFLLKLEPWS